MGTKTELFNYDHLSLTTYYLRIKYSKTDRVFATCTGFMYLYEDIYYLITNGHNITGVNPENNERISKHAGIPDTIEVTYFTKSPQNPELIGKSQLHPIALYEDEDCLLPRWYVHPAFGYNVDVVAIPITSKGSLPSHIVLTPINSHQFDTDSFPSLVSDDVFILGYPLDIIGKFEFPIWKRGNIATEPLLDMDDLPKMLIDTATRSGMSGSPVIYQRNGVHLKDGKLTDDSLFGRIRGFLGIYSGRIGANDNFQAQLGIVWKSSVIENILRSKKIGDIQFQ